MPRKATSFFQHVVTSYGSQPISWRRRRRSKKAATPTLKSATAAAAAAADRDHQQHAGCCGRFFDGENGSFFAGRTGHARRKKQRQQYRRSGTMSRFGAKPRGRVIGRGGRQGGRRRSGSRDRRLSIYAELRRGGATGTGATGQRVQAARGETDDRDTIRVVITLVLTPLGLGSSQPASRTARARAGTVTKNRVRTADATRFCTGKETSPQLNTHRGRVASR